MQPLYFTLKVSFTVNVEFYVGNKLSIICFNPFHVAIGLQCININHIHRIMP